MGENPKTASQAAEAALPNIDRRLLMAEIENRSAEIGIYEGRRKGIRIALWPMFSLILLFAVAAFLAGRAVHLSSSRADPAAAIEKFQQAISRMERQIALQSSAAAAASRSALPARDGADLLNAANVHYREGRYQSAVVSFRAAAAADTGGQFSDESHYRYGVSLLKTGDPNGALGEFQAVITGSPGSAYFAASAMETARLLMDKKNYGRARRTLYQLLAARDRLTAADKDYVERAYFLAGQCLESEAGAPEPSPLPAAAELQSAGTAPSPTEGE